MGQGRSKEFIVGVLGLNLRLLAKDMAPQIPAEKYRSMITMFGLGKGLIIVSLLGEEVVGGVVKQVRIHSDIVVFVQATTVIRLMGPVDSGGTNKAAIKLDSDFTESRCSI